jgi:hypothetical protein
VLAFDNLSALAPWLSDALCRLASGGSFAVRQLYTDQDEVLFDAARPSLLNGIEDDPFNWTQVTEECRELRMQTDLISQLFPRNPILSGPPRPPHP